jgi:hypothetical protein
MVDGLNGGEGEEDEVRRIGDAEWSRLKSNAWKEGYREGVDKGTEEALQQGNRNTHHILLVSYYVSIKPPGSIIPVFWIRIRIILVTWIAFASNKKRIRFK